MTDDEEYIPRNREKAKTASYGFFVYKLMGFRWVDEVLK